MECFAEWELTVKWQCSGCSGFQQYNSQSDSWLFVQLLCIHRRHFQLLKLQLNDAEMLLGGV